MSLLERVSDTASILSGVNCDDSVDWGDDLAQDPGVPSRNTWDF